MSPLALVSRRHRDGLQRQGAAAARSSLMSVPAALPRLAAMFAKPARRGPYLRRRGPCTADSEGTPWITPVSSRPSAASRSRPAPRSSRSTAATTSRSAPSPTPRRSPRPTSAPTPSSPAASRAAFPGDPGRHRGAGRRATALSAPVFFLVDPLDGTKEFVQRRGDFTVNIALIENGVPTRGVVYAPAQGRLFYTDAAGRSQEEAGPFGADARRAHPAQRQPRPTRRRSSSSPPSRTATRRPTTTSPATPSPTSAPPARR